MSWEIDEKHLLQQQMITVHLSCTPSWRNLFFHAECIKLLDELRASDLSAFLLAWVRTLASSSQDAISVRVARPDVSP